MREAEIQRRIQKILKKNNIIHWTTRFPPRGTPDIIAFPGDGEAIFIEVKTDKGRLSKIQEWMINNLREKGYKVKVIRTPEETETFLKEVRYGE